MLSAQSGAVQLAGKTRFFLGDVEPFISFVSPYFPH